MNAKKIYVNYNEELNGFEIKYGWLLTDEEKEANTKLLKLGWNKIAKHYYAKLTSKNEQFYLDYVHYLKEKKDDNGNRVYVLLPLTKKATK